jgi:hypothetical protein
MQNSLLIPPLDSAEKDGSLVFNVVIAYEDFETGKQAMRIYDTLVENLGQRWRFENQMWKFDVLSIPKLREMAANDAIKADLVIVSCHGDDLPQGVRKWFEHWVGQNLRPSALAAIFDYEGSAPQARALRAYLSALAARGHMEFFFAGEATVESKEGPVSVDRSPELKTSLAFAGAMLRDSLPCKWDQGEEVPRFR